MSLQIPATNTISSERTMSDDANGRSTAPTLVDVNAISADKSKLSPEPETAGQLWADKENASPITEKSPKLSQKHKYGLLVVFCMAMFIDILLYSAMFIFTGPISLDLGVEFESQSWVITAYAVTFSSFLLLWGRISDLYSPKPVFSHGFITLGVLNIVISFLPDKYSFFVIRALSGAAGSALIPSAFRLIVSVFDSDELSFAFTIYGLSGALANVTGIIIAAVISYIPTSGQGADWRWFFRISAVIILPIAFSSLWLIPKPQGSLDKVGNKWKRLDLVGALSMLFAIILLILGLTLGASYGWKKPGFLVPFFLSVVLFPFFFFWEARLPEGYALLPPATWRIPNFTILIIFALYIYSWWSLNFLPFVETFVRVHGDSPMIAAVRLLPQGLSAISITILLTLVPKIVANPRWPIIIGTILGIGAYALFSQSGEQVGLDYWKFLFPAFIFGSASTMMVFTATNVGIMTSVPAEMAGVAGAVLQVSLQVGAAVGLSIQAGLLTVFDGALEDWRNTQISFYFMMGWGVVWLVAFIIWYKPRKVDDVEGGKVIMAH